MFDVLIAGGTVVDGNEAPAYKADVGVTGETIAAVGDLARADARRVIDATGLMVAPGFIDPHVHSEGDLLVNPQHAYGLRQGITTELLGIDGMSYAPLSRENYLVYRRWLKGLLGEPPEDLDMSSVAAFRANYHRKVAVNTAYLAPNGTVRLEVVGFHDRPLVGEAMDAAKKLVRESLEQGAVGFSTGSSSARSSATPGASTCASRAGPTRSARSRAAALRRRWRSPAGPASSCTSPTTAPSRARPARRTS